MEKTGIEDQGMGRHKRREERKARKYLHVEARRHPVGYFPPYLALKRNKLGGGGASQAQQIRVESPHHALHRVFPDLCCDQFGVQGCEV